MLIDRRRSALDLVAGARAWPSSPFTGGAFSSLTSQQTALPFPNIPLQECESATRAHLTGVLLESFQERGDRTHRAGFAVRSEDATRL